MTKKQAKQKQEEPEGVKQEEAPAEEVSGEVVVDTSKALLPANEVITTPTGQIISWQAARTVANRLYQIFPQPDKEQYQLSKAEIVVTAEIALSMGCNPLAINKEYFAWKDHRGNLNIMRHYAYEVAWAQGKEPFTPVDRVLTVEEKVARGLGEQDYAVAVTIIRRSMERDYQRRYSMVFGPLVQSGTDPKQAMELAKQEAMETGVTAVGIVKYDEVYDAEGKLKVGTANLKGWEPGVTRAKVRATRQAIHAAYGIPTTAELAQSGVFGKPMTDRGLNELAQSADMSVESAQVQRRYNEIAEATQERDGSTLEERTNALRGEKEPDDIGDDWQNGDFTEEPAEEEAFVAEGPSITKEEALEILYTNGVGNCDEVDGLTSSLFDKPVKDLNEVELHNLVQYVRRRRILRMEKNGAGEELTLAQRFSMIPEIVKLDDKPEDVEATLTRLKNFALKMSKAGKKMSGVYIEEPVTEESEDENNQEK